MKVGCALNFDFLPGEHSLSEVKESVEQSLNIVYWPLRFSLVCTAAHVAKSANNFSFFFFGKFSADGVC